MTISVDNKFAEDDSASGNSASTVDGDGGSCLMNPLVDDGSTKDDSINSEHHHRHFDFVVANAQDLRRYDTDTKIQLLLHMNMI